VGTAENGFAHSDLGRGWVQHERVLIMETPPARQYFLAPRARLARGLVRGRSAAKLDEEFVGQIAKLEVTLVHP
jgi:hypothetical protein